MNKKISLAFIIFALGFLGILSLLTMDVPLSPDMQAVLKDFTPLQIKLLMLVNPTFLLVASVAIGTVLLQKVHLNAPIIEKSVGLSSQVDYASILKFGIGGGILVGVLLLLIERFFHPLLPSEFLALGESLKPSVFARLLYGGLTEEILMRFGLMTLMVWLATKIFKSTKPMVYWLGIVLSALIFALGHFPIAFQAVAHPSAVLLAFILIGNLLGGLIFGWLYWKKGLESAFIGHVFAHVIMIMVAFYK